MHEQRAEPRKHTERHVELESTVSIKFITRGVHHCTIISDKIIADKRPFLYYRIKFFIQKNLLFIICRFPRLAKSPKDLDGSCKVDNLKISYTTLIRRTFCFDVELRVRKLFFILQHVITNINYMGKNLTFNI